MNEWGLLTCEILGKRRIGGREFAFVVGGMAGGMGKGERAGMRGRGKDEIDCSASALVWIG